VQKVRSRMPYVDSLAVATGSGYSSGVCKLLHFIRIHEEASTHLNYAMMVVEPTSLLCCAQAPNKSTIVPGQADNVHKV
jgi:hypothetical protein